MTFEVAQNYADPFGGTDSTIGTQARTDFFQKKALIEARKEQYFSQLADVTSMPKNMGKRIKRFHYLPLLDDANINDQGIDANGLIVEQEVTIFINKNGIDNLYTNVTVVGKGATAAAALTDAETKALDALVNQFGFTTGAYATVRSTAIAAGYTVSIPTSADAVMSAGNLYGSSKDIGTIASKLPALTENGGRVNRVGFKRIELVGEIHKFGFFDEYTQESLDFDSDDELEMHINREMVVGANEMTEDALQIDLINGAGVIRYGGTATSNATISGETGAVSLITYNDLMRLAIDLNDNRCPKATKVITGSRMIDTKTIDGARILYIGSELETTVRSMLDQFSNPAFIAVQHYAAAGTTLTGEIGTLFQFRIVVVPEMMKWEGGGATATTNDGYQETNGSYDVFPMLVVGSGSFTTIGFQTDGKTVKFKITHKKPGADIANRDDPYGEVGFMSIKWYYGSMILRPEWIALCKTVAPWN
jgi:N4-gp56 family major capsid protein